MQVYWRPVPRKTLINGLCHYLSVWTDWYWWDILTERAITRCCGHDWFRKKVMKGETRRSVSSVTLWLYKHHNIRDLLLYFTTNVHHQQFSNFTARTLQCNTYSSCQLLLNFFIKTFKLSHEKSQNIKCWIWNPMFCVFCALHGCIILTSYLY